MKRSFKKVAFGRLCNTPVAMQISVPLSMFLVVEMAIGIIMDLLVHERILLVLRNLVSQQSCNYRFILRPPKLHVLPILLHWFIVHIAIVDRSEERRVGKEHRDGAEQ